MEIFIIALAAFLASGLTLLSGFGLGTLLMPVIALFFPVDIAIGVTALVHLTNNLFKMGLMGGKADKGVILRFGVPAMLAAFAGAWLLGRLASLPALVEYPLADGHFQVMPIKLIIGFLILVFVVLESIPAFKTLAFDARLLTLGGFISGFFGGLSGNQGAFRSMFLLKAGLGKEEFIATGVVLAAMIDVARLLIYGWDATVKSQNIHWPLVVVASLAAFGGAWIGKHLVEKMTIRSIQIVVSVLLVVVALGLMSGLL